MNKALSQNLENLHQYWLALGAEQSGELFQHTSWPNKRWNSTFSFSNVFSRVGERLSTIDQVDASKLNECSKDLGFTLQAMMQLEVMTLTLPTSSEYKTHDEITHISTTDQARKWTLACSEAFAYSLDETVIQHVLKDPNCYLFALFKDGKIAGTVLLFQTGRTLGIHQLGTVRAFRKMGVAAQLMAHSLSFASELGCDYAVLQASKAGIPLYSKLGFERLATITSVQAV
ncbi:GNAT family N-acetyltransferase [Enterovibrio sp. ZSDZ35]|uniref:GNAT family N-acetyltransferase n=1 Tax=Enterovibrio qingdaonensis TaxID=2899818 RepID=A0ABT5QIA6_9GAMM|nr:GNAT family N-acetyltransferase [Enterovibrio sp. ZSDZ35]MDD1780195.1 GNAT family N-acetyltransferase [Enterovibrio sp. ZSDZ35]